MRVKALLILILLIIPSLSWATNYCQDASIVACYLAQTGSGTSLVDSSSNGYNGTFASSGHPAWITTIPSRSYLAYSISITTSSDYVTLGTNDTTTFKPGQAMSFVAWVYPLTNGNNGDSFTPRMTSRNNSAESTIASGSANSGSEDIQFNINGSQNLSVVTSNGVIPENSWYHIVVTWDGSTTATNVHIYINGSETTYQTQQNGVTLSDQSSGTLYLGNNASFTREFDGYMTEIAYFKRALSSSDVTSIYNNGLLQTPVSSNHGFARFL